MASRAKAPDAYDFGSNDWSRWQQRFNIFIEAAEDTNKTEKTKIYKLLNCIGADGVDVYNTFNIDIESASLDAVLKKFEDHCNPRKNEVFQRYLFWERKQVENEPIDTFIIDLKRLAKRCNFKDQHDQMVRDKIVFGCNDPRVKERLLREDDLDLKRAREICLAAESSQKQMQLLKGATSEVHTIKRSTKRKCGYCGMEHAPRKCPAYGKSCKKCGRLNHFQSVCRSSRSEDKPVHEVQQSQDEQKVNEFFINTILSQGEHCWHVPIEFGERGLDTRVCKIDSGAAINVMSSSIYEKLSEKPALHACNYRLKAYGNQPIRVRGKITLQIKIPNRPKTAEEFIITDTADDVIIIGLPTIESTNIAQLKIKPICSILEDNPVRNLPSVFYDDKILSQYIDLFGNDLGCLPYEHTFTIDEAAKPIANPPRKMPIQIQSKVKAELDKMVQLGVITEQVEPTDWVNSLVTVHKTNGDIRICLDPTHLNKAIKRQHYPLNTIDKVIAKIPGAKVFSKLDAKSGFWQMRLDSKSSKMCTFNSPWGRYRFLRLPFGTIDASEVYQRVLSEYFSEWSEVIIDDILIWGRTYEEHDRKLEAILKKAREVNIRFNPKKLEYRKSKVTYAGHELTSDGVMPDKSKVKAITEMPKPNDKAGVMRLLGMVTYLSKFIPNLSELDAPLRKIIRNQYQFDWGSEQDNSFEKLKEILSSNNALSYFDSEVPITLQVDSSKDGLGGVLLQNGKPVAYVSCALTATQQAYSQIEKETLAVLVTCKKLHQYIFGAKNLLVQTDHKPLETVFKKDLSNVPSRLSKMILQLKKYNLEVKWFPGKQMIIADTLSRAFVNETEEKIDKSIEVEVHELQKCLPISDEKYKILQNETINDETLRSVSNYLINGWPEFKKLNGELRCFYTIKHDLQIHDKILFKGTSMVIPRRLRQEILNLLHESHLGIEKTRRRARQAVYWPNFNKDIKDMIFNCNICQKYQKKNPKETLLSHDRPQRPWVKLGCDLFHFGGDRWLALIDYYSTWIEIIRLSSNTSAREVIDKLKSVFARFGIPEQIFSDNGPPFQSAEFANFAKAFDFIHTTSSPRFPQSNGMAEKAVAIAKNILRKADDPATALMEYRATPVSGMNFSPSQLMFGRNIRTKLPVSQQLLDRKPDHTFVDLQRGKSVSSQKKFYDRNARDLAPLQSGEYARMRVDNNGRNVWQPVVIMENLGNRSYVTLSEEGQELRRNRRDLRKSNLQPGIIADDLSTLETEAPIDDTINATVTSDMKNTSPVQSVANNEPVVPTLRRSERLKNKAPVHYGK